MKVYMVILFLVVLALQLSALEKLVVIGKGPAGLSAAIYAGQAHLNPLVIEGEECDGQLVMINRIENYPGFPEGIEGESLMERMRLQAENFGARFLDDYAVAVDLQSYPFLITVNDGEEVACESVIIATGSSPRWLGVAGEEALKGLGVSASAICDGPLFQGKEVVVVGGGDAALEQALLLTDYAAKVTILHRDDHFTASSYLVERVFSHPSIDAIFNSKVEEILGVEQGWVIGILLSDLKTGMKKKLMCAGILVAVGRKPNTDLFWGK